MYLALDGGLTVSVDVNCWVAVDRFEMLEASNEFLLFVVSIFFAFVEGEKAKNVKASPIKINLIIIPIFFTAGFRKIYFISAL